ncbi:dynamin family protein [Pseudoalteromonas sp. SA25]|uniref:dynamin family protein n=1 Tax=Pseudoalteromonas sp. SA25 TaxID=2686347 RepID=UPI0013FD29D9|nr:dynamin family protein [Pseudoalteromonas sp. SA25]
MNIIKLNNQIEDFVKKNDLVNDSLALKQKYAISTSDDWQEVLNSFNDDGRVLKIGVVGRVKAGKSSMLNALLFDGEDLLPKAATPMTAALTIIKFSDKVKASVEFFSEKDIAEIKNNHDCHNKALSEKIELFTKEQKERLSNKKKRAGAAGFTEEDIKSCEEKAKKQAEREMKNEYTFAAFDQYCKIKASGKTFEDLEKFKEIEADSLKSLMNGKLNDFVGANGPYMPFTKSVTLHIPHKGLEGLEVIDTPGINDPVSSRGIRTEELLQHCDVVIVVSPSGQFFSEEDKDLLLRITTKEGTQEAYLMASQVDNQLFGSASQDLSSPVEIIDNIKNQLTSHARSTLQYLTNQYPEMKVAYDKLSQNNVICTSSIAYAMCERFEHRSSWDSNMNHVWNNLKDKFPTEFSGEKSAKNTLKSLANIGRLHTVISEVTSRKTEILKKRQDDFINDKLKALNNYVEGLHKDISERINLIEEKDVAELRKQTKNINESNESIKLKVGADYNDLIIEGTLQLTKKLKTLVKEKFESFKNASNNTEIKTGQEPYEVCTKERWYWFNEYETRFRDVTIINATGVRTIFNRTLNDIKDEINENTIKFIQGWKKNLKNQVIEKMRNILSVADCEENLMLKAIDNVVASIPQSNFQIRDELPDDLNKSGKLRKGEAERFYDAMLAYAHNLENMIRANIESYTSEFESNLKKVKLAESLTLNLSSTLAELVSEIENKEVSLYRYKKMQDELSRIKTEL